jgi:hypothetical protein
MITSMDARDIFKQLKIMEKIIKNKLKMTNG